MKTLRRLCYATLGVAYTHLVFGAIVRISGSGMGCGDNWPKCYGHWFPPFDRPQLVIEWTHRLLASLLILSIVGLATATVLKRREPGVSGRGGVLRPVASAVGVVLVTAAFGAVTVFLGNPTWATVVHWTLAMTLLAVVTTAAIRSGALGGAAARSEQAAPGTTRSAYLAAAMAFATVVMGGLTAKFPFGSVACQSFPGCGRNAAAPDDAVWVQGIHRTIAILLVLHLIGMAIAGRKRADGTAIKRATLVAALLGVAQIVIAASMVLFHLPAPLRSLHEAVGVAIWLSTFSLAYLARLASRREPAGGAEGATLPPAAPVPAGDPLPATATVRASSRSALSRAADVQRDSNRADADATLVVEPTEQPRRGGRERRDVVGRSFPTAVVGEIELVDPDAIAGSDRLSADAIGTAALIAAVERADAATVADPTPTAGDTAAELSLLAEALAAMSSVALPVDWPAGATVERSQSQTAEESVEAATDASVDLVAEHPTEPAVEAQSEPTADFTVGQTDDPSIDRSAASGVELAMAPESIEGAARSAADGIAGALEALHALTVEHEIEFADAPDAPDALELAPDALELALEPAIEPTASADTELAGANVDEPIAAAGTIDAEAVVATASGGAADASVMEPSLAAAPAGTDETPAVAAPADALSVTAEVQEAGSGEGVGDAQKARPHTMAVIVARGADL